VMEYMLYSFLGCVIRTTILSAAGWFGGRQYGFLMEIFSNSEDHLLMIAIAVLCSALVAWIVLRGKRTT
jgi:membrane protein DedA with SNARE-associated domain